MSKRVHYLGLDVHKETIAVAIAPEGDTEVRNYGIIGGTLAALDKLIKKLQQPGVELRLVYEAGPCGYVTCELQSFCWLTTRPWECSRSTNTGASMSRS